MASTTKKSSSTTKFRKSTAKDLAKYDAGFLLGLYRDMLRTRALDDRVEALYKQGKLVAGCFSCRGQEGCSVGSTAALHEDDIIGPMIRNLGSMLRHGLPMTMVLRNYLGRANGPTKGRDGNTHFGALEYNIVGPVSMLGTLISVCAGVAFAFQIRREDRVAMTWIGDGGSNCGDFHEGMNFAGVLKLPLVVVLENNKYAYSTPLEHQTAARNFVCRAEGYGIRGDTVDGNDVLAVYEVTKEAVDRARAGEGPTLIEADTMRMRGHAIHDDAKYVPDEMFEAWEKRDPIRSFAERLGKADLLDDELDGEIRAQVKTELEAETEDAMAQPLPDPAHELEGVYA
ncbi:MAG: thiamine pyrophosphate-dependent dehydrogenase E1 component subunit alpha [Planctomycetota bacterium]